jgi:hypothetical protein
MEVYKVDQSICSHPEWREDMFSRTCKVCGYNNLIEDYQIEKNTKQCLQEELKDLNTSGSKVILIL